MTDPPVSECPECGEEAERILSAGAGLLFKGEGFYITDYRSDSYRKAAEKEKKKPDSGSGTAGSGKGDGGSKSKDAPGTGAGKTEGSGA